MFGEQHDPEFLKHLFETTEILRKPVAGIIAGYHVLPYILVGPQEAKPASSVEIRGKIKVPPRLGLAPGRAGQPYGDLSKHAERMEVARLLDGKDDRALSRRPDARSWARKEIVCHLRDVEELFLVRFQTILTVEEPPILTLSATPEALARWGIGGAIGHPLDPDRWAEERQYSRSDGREALQAFGRRRREGDGPPDPPRPRQRERGGIPPARGRLGVGE